MILYLDASAVVKFFMPEAGAENVLAVASEAAALATSRVTATEVLSAFGRLHREGWVSEEQRTRLEGAFKVEWELFGALDVPEWQAGERAILHNLRALDAIHLATAFQLSRETQLPVTFLSFDKRLNQAALDAGLRVPPTEGPIIDEVGR